MAEEKVKRMRKPRRNFAREMNLLSVYVDASVEVLSSIDANGEYTKARLGAFEDVQKHIQNLAERGVL